MSRSYRVQVSQPKYKQNSLDGKKHGGGNGNWGKLGDEESLLDANRVAHSSDRKIQFEHIQVIRV
jgi:hypothetical protein